MYHSLCHLIWEFWQLPIQLAVCDVCLIPSWAFLRDICLIITLVIFHNNDHVDFAQQRSICCHPKRNNRISIMNQIVQTTTYLCSSGVSTKFPTKKLCLATFTLAIYSQYFLISDSRWQRHYWELSMPRNGLSNRQGCSSQTFYFHYHWQMLLQFSVLVPGNR